MANAFSQIRLTSQELCKRLVDTKGKTCSSVLLFLRLTVIDYITLLFHFQWMFFLTPIWIDHEQPRPSISVIGLIIRVMKSNFYKYYECY